MMIEKTFMKFGKGLTGIIGKTKNLRIIQIWVKSQHKCSEVLQNLDELRNRDDWLMTKHRENTAKITNDQVDKFQSSLLEGFQSKIKRKAVTMKTSEVAKKKKTLWSYNTEIILSMELCLNFTNKLKINDLF